VTVDADSLITSDYAIRLVHIMEQSGNECLAIAQTPYTAIPHAPVALENTAAASTDGQYFNHQGLSFFDASFWVGASALMRYAALEDIAREVDERGHRVKVYIEDKILVEDMAATIDLIGKGWRVYHDPGRLSYSATPLGQWRPADPAQFAVLRVSLAVVPPQVMGGVGALADLDVRQRRWDRPAHSAILSLRRQSGAIMDARRSASLLSFAWM
jgi:cellulose synthase/poly-beta-1,6-N-acetylglucosamine synthase-like glycosyltransferase